jgi:hypothetical protein
LHTKIAKRASRLPLPLGGEAADQMEKWNVGMLEYWA